MCILSLVFQHSQFLNVRGSFNNLENSSKALAREKVGEEFHK